MNSFKNFLGKLKRTILQKIFSTDNRLKSKLLENSYKEIFQFVLSLLFISLSFSLSLSIYIYIYITQMRAIVKIICYKKKIQDFEFSN